MNKFCLLVKYENGESATLTEKPDLNEALEELVVALKSKQVFKSDVIPRIIEAKLVRITEWQ